MEYVKKRKRKGMDRLIRKKERKKERKKRKKERSNQDMIV